MATIQEVYIALFGRPADPLGYQYYVEATDDGANLDAVGDLSGSEEYGARFEGMTTVQMINQIYLDLFNRDADAAGLTFYFNLISSGEASFQDIAIRILDGATGTDQEIVDNKVLAAQLFTDSLDTGAEIAAYQGDSAADAGRTFLTGITEDPATIPSQEDTDAFIAGIVDGSIGGGSGATVALTDAIGEAVEGTNGNDTFTGVLDGGGDGTFQFGDQVNGLTGTDTFNIFVQTNTDFPAGAELNSVEIINLEQATNVMSNIDATDFGAAAQQIWQIDDVGDIEGLTDAQTAGFRDVQADVVVTGAGATVNIALDNALTDSDITVDGADVTAINLSGTVDGYLVLYAGADVTDLASLTVSLTEDGEVRLDPTVLDLESFTTFDGSGSTGGIIVNFDNATTGDFLTDITLGSGSDDAYYDMFESNNEDGGAVVTIDLGDGDDLLTVNVQGNVENNRLEITLGAGNDEVVEDGSFNNIVDSSEGDFEDGLMVITDFDGAEDVLNIASTVTALATLTNTEAADIADEASLFDALGVAAAFFGAGEDTMVFAYDGNTYVLRDSDASATFSDGDGLIELTGVAVADLTAASFVTA